MFVNLDPIDAREQELVHQIALVFEQGGLPPVAGRIVGWLLLCDPPHQSSTELADRLHASRGAISTSTRALIRAGLVERVRFPRDRKSYFRIAEGCWTRWLRDEYLRVRRLRELGDQALALLADRGAGPAQVARARQFRDFSAFFEEEFPALFARWEDRRVP